MAIALPLCPAQDNQNGSPPPKTKPLPGVEAAPNGKPLPSYKQPKPFPLDSSTPADRFTLEVRTPEQMTENDRNLEADAESTIAERAGIDDVEFIGGKWNFQQLVCPDLPNHLLLRFTQDNGVDDRSVFTVSIPRNHEGRVRVIPILRGSYSPFVPAPMNEITIAVFNQLRNEEKAKNAPSWVGLGLCYAALAGANPVAVPLSDVSLHGGFPVATSPTLEIPVEGGAIVHIADASARPRPLVLNMTFNKQGRLLKVDGAADEVMNRKPLPPVAPSPKE